MITPSARPVPAHRRSADVHDLRGDPIRLTQGVVRRFPPDLFGRKPSEQGMSGRVHEVPDTFSTFLMMSDLVKFRQPLGMLPRVLGFSGQHRASRDKPAHPDRVDTLVSH